MPYWLPKRDEWEGQDAFVIGGGPSLKSFDYDLLVGRNVIGCNDAYKLGAKICGWCHFGDSDWFLKHRSRLLGYGGRISTSLYDLLNNDFGVLVVRRKDNGVHLDAVGWNGNTGTGALNLALLAGATRVFLLGFDRKTEEETGDSNWHENEVDRRTQDEWRDIYGRFLSNDAKVVEDCKRKFPKAQVFNANPDSLMKGFPKVDWRDMPWLG